MHNFLASFQTDTPMRLFLSVSLEHLLKVAYENFFVPINLRESKFFLEASFKKDICLPFQLIDLGTVFKESRCSHINSNDSNIRSLQALHR